MITQSNASNKPRGRERYSWIDFRRRVEDVSEDKRVAPRIEFHCPVRIEGFRGEKRITDISLRGLFIECENTLRRRLHRGHILRLFMKLPTEGAPIMVKVRIVNVGDRGIGCEFILLNQKNRKAIGHCFDVFKHTLPIT